MIRDITIGQYYSANSMIHRLDPRVKLVITLFYIISLFLFSNFAGFAMALLFFGAVVIVSTVPIRYILKGLKPIFMILIFTGILNLLWTPGKTVVSWGIINITWEGIEKSVFISLRLIFLILGSSMLTLTTTPNQLTAAIESLLKPLNVFHVPVHELAMMMSIALRFIPILVEETDKIMKAQTARGADFESGNIIQRLKSMLPIFVPLFVSAIRRANDLALAMDARCYHGGKGRTKMHPLRYHGKDVVAYLLGIVYFVGIILIGKTNLW